MDTIIKWQDGTISNTDISNMEFIPNGMFNEFSKLIAKDDEERVNLLRTCSYHTQKKYVSKEQTEDFKFPCVYYTYKDGSLNLRYSSTNENGCFNIPKVIWSQGISTPIIDMDGKYGINEFAYAIIDEPKNIPFIQESMLNPDFIKLMSNTVRDGHRYNHKVISLFRKDFWKDFI